MSKEELRNRLLGTWQLVGSVIRFEEGDFETSLVMNFLGFLIYTAERRLDCTATQWAGKSAIENSAVAACTTAARGRHRVLQEIPFSGNRQLYRRSQASESDLT